MGFFDKLFSKKVCDICGEEIGMLGNRKLEDGNCCKECAKKLSPLFNDRRHSTVEDIRAQIEAREENKQAVANFHITRSLGRKTRVLVDEDAGVFMVTAAKDLEEANPDVIRLSQVTGCTVNIDESRREVKREVKNSEGETHSESYRPPRYRYSYSFSVDITLNHPYLDDIRVPVTISSIEVEPSYRELRDAGVRTQFSEGSPVPPSMETRQNNVEYAENEEIAREIKEVLTESHPAGRKAPRTEENNFRDRPVPESASEEAPPQEEAPRPKVTCPWCNAETVGKDGCCEFCGGPLNG